MKRKDILEGWGSRYSRYSRYSSPSSSYGNQNSSDDDDWGGLSKDEFKRKELEFELGDEEPGYRRRSPYAPSPRPAQRPAPIAPGAEQDYHLRNAATGKLLSKEGKPSVFSSERHAMAVAAKLKFGSWEPVPAGKGVAEGVVRIKVSELSVNRNTTVHKWQLRSDKNFGLINEVPSVILKNVSVSIDQNAYDNDRKIFAYLQGEKTDSVPRGLKSFPIVYQRNGTYPFIDKSTGDPIENVAYVEFTDQGKVIGYQQGVTEGPEENKKWRDQARDASKEKRPWSPTNLPNYKKNKEQGVEEGKMDPEKRARLKDLIDQFSDSVDPSDYASYLDPDEIIDTIRQEFGDRIADQVRSGAEKMHFGRGYGYSGMGDPISKNMRGNTGDYRVTKGGKMHGSDVNALKSRIKSANYRPFGTKKPVLPEEMRDDGITPETASYILRKMEQGVPMSEILVDFPELGRKMEIIAGELGLHPDDDFEDIEAALYHELEDMVDQNDRDVEEADSQLQVKQIDKATGNVTAMDPKTQQTTQLKASDLKPDATKPGSFTATMTDPNEVKPGATITAKTAEAVHRQQGANPMGQDELGSTYTQSTISGDEDHDEVTKLLTNRLRQLAGLE